MKKIFTAFLSIITFASFAQQQVTISTGAGYTQDSYYKLSDGSHTEVSNSNWDLAIATGAMDISIRANHKKGINVYSIDGDSAAFMVVTDTTGMKNGWDAYYNSDETWEIGALNASAGSGQLDYGWGEYDLNSHSVNGTRFFILSSASMTKKVFIKKKTITNVYTFMVANIDNSELHELTFSGTTYADKIFYYYDATSNTLLDREPAKTAWDLVATRYYGDLGGGMYYPVVGVLQNPKAKIMQVDKVDVTTVDPATYHDSLYSANISTIGYDWKTFNGSGYDIADSTVYFVKTAAPSSEIYKLVFTAFGGGATGDITFNQEVVSAVNTGVNEANGNISTLVTYPNPAKDIVNLVTDVKENEAVTLTVADVTGKIVSSQQVQLKAGLSAVQLNTSAYANGIYFVRLNGNNINAATRLSVAH